VASSRDVVGARRLEDRSTADPIFASLHRPFADQVDGSTEQRAEFLLHLDQIEQRPASVRGEGNEEVDVALRPEIVAQDRTEERQLGDPPTAAERLDRLS